MLQSKHSFRKTGFCCHTNRHTNIWLWFKCIATISVLITTKNNHCGILINLKYQGFPPLFYRLCCLVRLTMKRLRVHVIRNLQFWLSNTSCIVSYSTRFLKRVFLYTFSRILNRKLRIVKITTRIQMTIFLIKQDVEITNGSFFFLILLGSDDECYRVQ
jgi:hypothetical protein